MAPAAIIAMIFQIIIGLITNSLYYKPIFNNDSSDFLTKIDSFPDIVFMCTKVLIILLFISDNGLESEHYAMLSFLILVTGINAYYTLKYQNRKNKFLMNLNSILSLILFFGFLTLFIGKFIKFLKFDGLIYLFIIEILVIVIFIISYQGKELSFLNINYKNINNSDKYLDYLIKVYLIIKNCANERNSSIIVKTFISKIEENCFNSDCPLKKYMENLAKGKENNFYLFLYYDKLFQYGISKFKNSINLKINYCNFLIIEMNNKKKAFFIINTIKNKLLSFLLNYNIYRCQELMDNYSIKENNENIFIAKYTDNLRNFKNLITKTILLQYEFLSLSLGCKIQKDDNYNKVYKISTKIKKLNIKIDNMYNEIINTQINNIEYIDLYSEYIEKIFEDEEKYQNCQKCKRNFSNNFNILKNNIYNFDINELNKKDCIPYLIVLADIKNLGIIKDCSASLGKIFGYQKEELINQKINILIPEIFHKRHDLIINQQSKNNKIKYLEDLSNYKFFPSSFLEKEMYGISKSKFLIPVKIHIYFVKTEENEFVYFLEIIENNYLNYDNTDFRCCILTNENLLIQTFTSNCLKYLKLSYNKINSNYDIVQNIKQFKDDYLIDINTSQLCRNSSLKESSIITSKKLEKTLMSTPSISKSIKDNIIKKNFLKKSNITWLIEEDNSSGFKNSKKFSKSSKSLKRKSFTVAKLLFFEDKEEKELSMEIKKIMMDNQIVGYYFLFSEPKNQKDVKTTIKHSSNALMNRNLDIYKSLKIVNEEINQKPKLNIHNILGAKKNDFKYSFKNKNFVEKSNPKVKFEDEDENKRINIEQKNIINEKILSNSNSNFIFDLNTFTYKFSNKILANNKLIEELKNEALIKIKNFQNKKIDTLNNSNNIISEIEEYNSPSSSNSYSSDYESSSFKSISRKNSLDIKNSKLTKIVEIKKRKSQTIIVIEKNKYNFINNYYKVNNIKNIHFLIFDYFKEIFVEENKENNVSKMETRLSELKNINNSNTEENLKEKKEPIKVDLRNSKKKIQENFIDKDNLINEEKLLEKNIILELNKQKDELPIKYLKFFSFIYYIIMIILLLICIFFYLESYSKLKQLLILIKNIVKIKYCDRMSVFYVGESTLLNFNADKIKGGIFYNYPASSNNKEGYIALMREKIYELYLENKKALKEILVSELRLSKNSTNYLKKISLNTDFIMNDGSLEIISGDIFTTLMHYNGAFYNLATSPYYLEQNHTDILNFLHNSFNDYARGINLLISIYCYELEQQTNQIKCIWIFLFIIFFIIYAFIYILIIYFYISANSKSQNYAKILNNIDEISFRKLIENCENLFKKIKKSEIKTLSDEEEDDKTNNDFEREKNIGMKKGQLRQNSLNAPNNTSGIFKSKNKLSGYIIGFMKNFFFILLISYSYYIYNGIFFINLGRRAILISQYFYRSQNFHSYMIDIFIAYRQYVFDDSIKIYNMLPFDYLDQKEKDSYKTLANDVQFMENFIQEYLSDKEEILDILNKSFCSFNFTDKFISYEDCENKIGLITNYDFIIIASNFLEELRTNKFLVKYLLSTGTIRGGLNDYDQNIWLKDPTIPKIWENVTSDNLFRLDLYNNETIHAHLDLVFVNIILPYINIHIKTILPNLSIDDKAFYLCLTTFFYIVFTTIICFIYLLLKIHNINKHIYKTKNMLTLIPANILASINNIKQLLEI